MFFRTVVLLIGLVSSLRISELSKGITLSNKKERKSRRTFDKTGFSDKGSRTKESSDSRPKNSKKQVVDEYVQAEDVLFAENREKVDFQQFIDDGDISASVQPPKSTPKPNTPAKPSKDLVTSVLSAYSNYIAGRIRKLSGRRTRDVSRHGKTRPHSASHRHSRHNPVPHNHFNSRSN